jgi:diguanylate cyclase (GGDEF)-like protein
MVNDRFGHLNGSSVLRQLADVLRDGAREVDSVIRFGGDEFVVLLLGATANTGLLAGERIRRKIENARFFLDDGNHISLTASIGVAAYPEHAKTRETLLKIADEMMYYSKKQGKNRVSLYKTRADHEPQQAKKSL